MLQVELIFCNVVVCEANGICCRSLIALRNGGVAATSVACLSGSEQAVSGPNNSGLGKTSGKTTCGMIFNVQFLEFSPVPKSEGPGATLNVVGTESRDRGHPPPASA